MSTLMLSPSATVPFDRQVDRSVSAEHGMPVAGVRQPISVRLARREDEWAQAFQLVAQAYRSRGYDAGAALFHFTPFQVLPDTATVIAESRGRVVATMTMIQDNRLLGLPMEKIYPQEIQDLRGQGRRLFETGCLASDQDLSSGEFSRVFLAMMRMSWQYQLANGADTAVIAINPRHGAFYTKVHGFMPLGPRRSYMLVQGHPAEAYYLDPASMKARAAKMHRYMFGAALPESSRQAASMSVDLVRYFARHSDLAEPALVEQILGQAALGNPRRW